MNYSMKTINTLLLVFGFFAGIPYADDPGVDRDGVDLNGPVKRLCVEEAWFEKKENRWIEGERFQASVLTYDNDGRLTEKIDYAGRDRVRDRFLRVYDHRGRLTEKLHYAASGRCVSKVTYAYDGKTDRSIEETDYRHYEIPVFVKQFRYDEKGNRIEKRLSDKNGLKYTIRHRYDKESRLQDSTECDAEGNLQLTTRFVYNERGLLTKSFLFDKANALAAYWIYTYGEDGRRTEMNAYTIRRGLEMRKTYAYDERGQLTDLASYGINGIFFSREKYAYQYDEWGNWIEKHERSARPTTSYTQPIRTIYRQIEYLNEIPK